MKQTLEVSEHSQSLSHQVPWLVKGSVLHVSFFLPSEEETCMRHHLPAKLSDH